jgi:hypothetical protein
LRTKETTLRAWRAAHREYSQRATGCCRIKRKSELQNHEKLSAHFASKGKGGGSETIGIGGKQKAAKNYATRWLYKNRFQFFRCGKDKSIAEAM